MCRSNQLSKCESVRGLLAIKSKASPVLRGPPAGCARPCFAPPCAAPPAAAGSLARLSARRGRPLQAAPRAAGGSAAARPGFQSGRFPVEEWKGAGDNLMIKFTLLHALFTYEQHIESRLQTHYTCAPAARPTLRRPRSSVQRMPPSHTAAPPVWRAQSCVRWLISSFQL